MIEGMLGAHPDILRGAGKTGRAIVAVNGPRAGKVGIVVGGGSGTSLLLRAMSGAGSPTPARSETCLPRRRRLSF